MTTRLLTALFSITSELGLINMGTGIKSALSSYTSICSKFDGAYDSSPFASGASSDSLITICPSDLFFVLEEDCFEFSCEATGRSMRQDKISSDDYAVFVTVVAFSTVPSSSLKCDCSR